MKDYFSTLSMEELERQFEESKYYKDEPRITKNRKET